MSPIRAIRGRKQLGCGVVAAKKQLMIEEEKKEVNSHREATPAASAGQKHVFKFI